MLDDFETQGFVVLESAFDSAKCTAMCNALWTTLQSRLGIDRNDRSTWTIEQPRGLGFLRKEGVFDQVGSPRVVAAVDELLGPEAWEKPGRWGGPLVTFPTVGDWQLPESGWHIDYPARGSLATPFAVKMLGLLADLEPGGGATLLARRSHHAVRQLAAHAPNGDAGSSAKVRETLDKTGSTYRSDIFEFVGKAGDVVLFDPWLFHCASKNVRETPRFMIEQNLPSRSALTLYA